MNIKRYYNALERRAFEYIYERKGFKTKRKIVVIESDDWGSIRMPSKNIYSQLLNAGISVNQCHYNKYDSMASKTDMGFLFELLSKFKDKNNNPVIITANAVVANPDFEKIKKSGFREYHFELFTDTLKRKTDNSVEKWKEGIKNKVFYPQYHGREHLNVNRWLNYLKNNSQELKTAFEHEVFGISSTISKEKNPSFMAALAVDNTFDYEKHNQILEEGYKLFEQIFDYKSLSFIAPNYTWHKQHENTLYKLGVRYLQGTITQKRPLPKQIEKFEYHYTGQVNVNNQIYLVRNCLFEPSSNQNKNWVDSCLSEINKAFNHQRPAIICSHRVNFIGSIVPENRDRNLKLFDELLKRITQKWPDVEFFTSDQLGNLIEMES
jgi:hypothetical protein